jgi:hypothetical protein
MTTTTTTIPNVPIPPGAVTVEDWDEYGQRGFEGRHWVVRADGFWHKTDFNIEISGIQQRSGEVDRVIHPGQLHPDNPITSAMARAVGEALIAAADEYDATAIHDSAVPGWSTRWPTVAVDEEADELDVSDPEGSIKP